MAQKRCVFRTVHGRLALVSRENRVLPIDQSVQPAALVVSVRGQRDVDGNVGDIVCPQQSISATGQRVSRAERSTVP